MTTSTFSDILRSTAAADTAALSARLAGEVIVPEDDEYDEARRVHNLRFDRRPAMVVRARGAADIAETVKFARAHNHDIAVRSGGHSVAGFSSVDGAVVIDLSEMRGVTIDPKAKTARVQAGATSGDLAGPAHAYGLSVSTGDTSSVGLGGLVTGGGIGWMARKHGLTIDNLLSAEIVTADGEVLRTSATEHPDLFWAIRGGGGNYGVVTEVELKLWSDGSVYGGTMVLPATLDVVRGYLEFALAAPDELTTIATIAKAPPLPFIPADTVGETVLMVSVCYAGSGRAGTRAVQPLRRIARPIAEALDSMPYPVMFEQTAMAARPSYGALRSGFAHGLSDAALAGAIAQVRDADWPMAMVQLRPLGGKVGRVAPEATAYAHRDKELLVSAIAPWMEASDEAGKDAWVEETWSVLGPETSGAFANFLGDAEAHRIREAYPSTTYARLACVKAKYDPENVFRHNQNIKPAGSAMTAAA